MILNKWSKYYGFQPFHLVKESMWPFYMSINLGLFLLGLILLFHDLDYGKLLTIYGCVMVLMIMFNWWKDIIEEGLYEGQHTFFVQSSLKIGFILFLLSEVMLFFALFWAYFHSSLSPTMQMGNLWPPMGMNIMSYKSMPLLNTIMLVLSGVTITWFHFNLLNFNKNFWFSMLKKKMYVQFESFIEKNISLCMTMFLGIFFMMLQVYEYINASFTMSDNIYGSCFFLLTGFHGFHVMIGTLFLIMSLLRNFYKHFTLKHHIGVESAMWYWHFVDVIWLFLFISIYIFI